jgi:hypothetical protein
MNIALCFLGSTHDDIDYEFLKSIKYYDVYVSLNNESESIKNKNINFIDISNSEIKLKKYMNCSYFKNSNKGKINELEKALYYFTFEKEYPHVWFINKDVLIFDENQLIRMDQLLKNTDFITYKIIESNKLKNVNWILWPDVTREGYYNFKAPFYHSLNNICRLSCAMLEEIKKYAIENKTLCYKDALFASLAVKNESLTHYEEDTIKYLKRVDDNILNNTTKIFCYVNNIEKIKHYRREYIQTLKSQKDSDDESDYHGDNELDEYKSKDSDDESDNNEPDINLNQESNKKTSKNNVIFNCSILLSLVVVAFQWLRNLTKSCKEEYED